MMVPPLEGAMQFTGGCLVFCCSCPFDGQMTFEMVPRMKNSIYSLILQSRLICPMLLGKSEAVEAPCANR